jgi:hypothetical protein
VRTAGQSRAQARAAERSRANAELCKVPLTEWLAMSRTERHRRAREARRLLTEEADRG